MENFRNVLFDFIQIRSPATDFHKENSPVSNLYQNIQVTWKMSEIFYMENLLGKFPIFFVRF